MEIDERLKRDVRLSEKLSLTPYKDSLGFWTIAYGHLMDVQDDSAADTVITLARAESLLTSDLSAAKLQAAQLHEFATCDTLCRQNALIELVFNMGASHWIKFSKTRGAIERQDWQAAHDGLLDSLWAKQVHETRANRIADYFLHGQYP